MQKYTFQWVGLFLLVISLSACSMEKRLYSSGFQINWNSQLNGTSHTEKLKRQNQPSNRIVNKTAAEIQTDAPSNNINSFEIEKAGKPATVKLMNPPKVESVSPNISSKPKSHEQIATVRSTLKLLKKNREKYVISLPDLLTRAIKHDSNRDKKSAGNHDYSRVAIWGLGCSALGLILMVITTFPFFMGITGFFLSVGGIAETLRSKDGLGFAISGLALSVLVLYLWFTVYSYIFWPQR